MGDPRAWLGAAAGVCVTLACALVWGVAAAWGQRQGQKRFLTSHLAGMGIRLALAGGLCAWAVIALDMRLGVFLLSFLGSYTLLMVAEVAWVLRQGRRFGGAGGRPGGADPA